MNSAQAESPLKEFEVNIYEVKDWLSVWERIHEILVAYDWANENGGENRDEFAIHLAFEEASVNAVRHGNQMDPTKAARIEFKIYSEKVWIRITDQGDGFNPDELPDPTDFENLERPCGRGVMLMRSYMTSVEYNDTANQVTMTKERTAQAEISTSA